MPTPPRRKPKSCATCSSEGDAWFRTGDLHAPRRARAIIYFVDRIGDTFRWKGENVSTTEVSEAIATFPGVREANVYGVSVPGYEGRAGMAALVVDDADHFDLAGLRAHIAAHLPAYARPVFLRFRRDLDMTGTFKQKKTELVAEGFDPALSDDPIYFDDRSLGAYARVTRGFRARAARRARSSFDGGAFDRTGVPCPATGVEIVALDGAAAHGEAWRDLAQERSRPMFSPNPPLSSNALRNFAGADVCALLFVWRGRARGALDRRAGPAISASGLFGYGVARIWQSNQAGLAALLLDRDARRGGARRRHGLARPRAAEHASACSCRRSTSPGRPRRRSRPSASAQRPAFASSSPRSRAILAAAAKLARGFEASLPEEAAEGMGPADAPPQGARRGPLPRRRRCAGRREISRPRSEGMEGRAAHRARRRRRSCRLHAIDAREPGAGGPNSPFICWSSTAKRWRSGPDAAFWRPRFLLEDGL